MPNGVALRQNSDALSGPQLEVLRSAYARLMRIFDNVVDGEIVQGYNWLAGLHGVPGWYCWHDSLPLGVVDPTGVDGNLFLPWHRAYILYFELSLRDLDPTVALPWWDWRNLNSVPQAFSEETVNGEPNPLYKGHISVPNVEDRDTRRFPGEGVPPTVTMPTPEEVDALYSITDFVQFSRALQRIHNRIHVWTGGESEEGVPGDMVLQEWAAYDPIFWSHHSMVDRVWYIWQLKNGVNNLPAEYFSAILAPFRLTVRDVLNIGRLGYDYVVSGYTVEA